VRLLLIALILAATACQKDEGAKFNCQDCDRVEAMEADIKKLKQAFEEFSLFNSGESLTTLSKSSRDMFLKYGEVINPKSSTTTTWWSVTPMFLLQNGSAPITPVSANEPFEEGYCPALFSFFFMTTESDEDSELLTIPENGASNCTGKNPIEDEAYLERAFKWAKEH
jgi:hypothetical protein